MVEKDKTRLDEATKDATAVGEEAAPADDDITDLKLRYYEQQITLSKHDDKYLDACKYWRQVLDTEAIEQDPEKLQASLQHVIHFVILAPYDNEQSDLLERIHRDSRNSTIPKEAELLKHFTKPEIMRWPSISQEFGPHLCSSDTFSADKPATGAKESDEGKAHQRWQDLRKRVIEHNVRVIAKYYTRIQFARLTELLDLSDDETEKYISELVVSKTIYAKIDRPARLVSFNKPKDADDVLNEWSGNMKSLLGLLELCDHQISKEVAMNALTIKSGAKGKAAA
jgi:26S proteasome regulatory subunit N5